MRIQKLVLRENQLPQKENIRLLMTFFSTVLNYRFFSGVLNYYQNLKIISLVFQLADTFISNIFNFNYTTTILPGETNYFKK